MKRVHKSYFGNIVLPDRIVQGTIETTGGKITGLTPGKSESVDVDYGRHGLYILPGLIEVHGHMREPGSGKKGTVPTETKAALAGGVTTHIDMPNTNPPTTTVELLKEKITKIYPGRSYTDYAFFMGAAGDKLEEIEKVDKNSIVGVKFFMAGHEQTPTTIPDDETLSKLFKILGERGIMGAAHAEDQYLINHYNDKYKSVSIPSAWSDMRPTDVVVSAATRAIKLAKKYKVELYLLHLSTPEEFALVDGAKKSGQKVYGELVGYQLVFNTTDYDRLGNKIKVAPALRTPKDQNIMWKRFNEGGVDVVCSEHTPHELETKEQPDVRIAQSGTPSIQETLPALITKYVERFGVKNLDKGLMLLARYMSHNPAAIFGFSQKGDIQIGKDADFTVVDTKKTWTVERSDLFSGCGWSAYEGMNLIGRPIATYLRGQLVYETGKILNPLGQGKLISREIQPQPSKIG